MMNRLTPSNALKQLADSDGVPFTEVFRHGSLQVEVYKPDGVDHQTPHTRDEGYVVISGSGQFINGDTRQPFEAGEVLFVPAGVDHRFEDEADVMKVRGNGRDRLARLFSFVRRLYSTMSAINAQGDR